MHGNRLDLAIPKAQPQAQQGMNRETVLAKLRANQYVVDTRAGFVENVEGARVVDAEDGSAHVEINYHAVTHAGDYIGCNHFYHDCCARGIPVKEVCDPKSCHYGRLESAAEIFARLEAKR